MEQESNKDTTSNRSNLTNILNSAKKVQGSVNQSSVATAVSGRSTASPTPRLDRLVPPAHISEVEPGQSSSLGLGSDLDFARIAAKEQSFEPPKNDMSGQLGMFQQHPKQSIRKVRTSIYKPDRSGCCCCFC